MKQAINHLIIAIPATLILSPAPAIAQSQSLSNARMPRRK